MPKQFRDRQILVTLGASTMGRWDELTASVSRDYQIRQTGVFPLQSLGIQCLVFVVPNNRDIDELVLRLQQDPRIEHAQRNQVFEGRGRTYSDTYAPLQHGAISIHAQSAHLRSTGKGVRVAIIDTGIDIDHVDLRGKVSHTENFVEGGESTFNTDIHGTAIAGVIAARADNKVGIFGIAPAAELIGLKACWYADAAAARASCSSWTLVKALDFAILDKAQVINLSLAGPEDTLVTRLIDRAVKNGIAVVAAVNDTDSPEIGFPAALPNVLGVVSSDLRIDAKKFEAGTHQNIVAAPGSEILTTTPSDAYSFLSGSSLATAHVAGILALLLETHPDAQPSDLYRLAQLGAPTVDTSTVPGLTIRTVDACTAVSQPNDPLECH